MPGPERKDRIQHVGHVGCVLRPSHSAVGGVKDSAGTGDIDVAGTAAKRVERPGHSTVQQSPSLSTVDGMKDSAAATNAVDVIRACPPNGSSTALLLPGLPVIRGVHIRALPTHVDIVRTAAPNAGEIRHHPAA